MTYSKFLQSKISQTKTMQKNRCKKCKKLPHLRQGEGRQEAGGGGVILSKPKRKVVFSGIPSLRKHHSTILVYLNSEL